MLTTEFPDASGLYAGLRGRAQRRARRHGDVDRADQDRHEGHDAHQPGHHGARATSRSSVQIANDLGEQVVNLVPVHHVRPAPALAAAPTCRLQPNQVPADVGAGRGAGHPAAAGHPGRRPQQAHRRAGHRRWPGRPATCAPSSRRAPPSPRSSSPTSSSSPSCWPMRPRPRCRHRRRAPSSGRTWPTRRRSSRCWPSRRPGCTPC